MLFRQRKKTTIRNAPGRPTNRYAGLITCGDCGAQLFAKRRKWKDTERVYNEMIEKRKAEQER